MREYNMLQYKIFSRNRQAQAEKKLKNKEFLIKLGFSSCANCDTMQHAEADGRRESEDGKGTTELAGLRRVSDR
jgi:hypothetical protein